MLSEREFSLVVESWLRSDRVDPTQVIDDVLEQLDGAPQRRAIAVPSLLPRFRLRAAWVAAALVAVAIIVAVAAELVRSDGGPGIGGASSGSPSAATPSPAPSRASAAPNRTTLDVDGIRLSFEQPPGWEGFGAENPDYISKSVRGPQGAEGQVVWAAFPSRGGGPGECAYLESFILSPSYDPSIAGLAATMASVPGTDVLVEPTATTVGGLPAMHLAFVVRDDVGCDPGFFYLYPNVYGGALWPETAPGDTVQVWIVDTPERRLVIEAKTKPDAGERLETQIETIVSSIVFE